MLATLDIIARNDDLSMKLNDVTAAIVGAGNRVRGACFLCESGHRVARPRDCSRNVQGCVAGQQAKRIETTILRIVRDSLLSRSVKEIYDYKCQVCSTRISVRDIPYAEGAHIRPLGKPHNGIDTPGNLICLCPNHHVMLDKGIFAIDNKFNLIGLKGELNIHPNHDIDLENLKYHLDHIYIND